MVDLLEDFEKQFILNYFANLCDLHVYSSIWIMMIIVINFLKMSLSIGH